VATKGGTGKIRQKNGRVHAREAGEGAGTQEKKTSGFVEDEMLGGRSVQKKDEGQRER